jgi:hypothetical protein
LSEVVAVVEFEVVLLLVEWEVPERKNYDEIFDERVALLTISPVP